MGTLSKRLVTAIIKNEMDDECEAHTESTSIEMSMGIVDRRDIQ